jgi:catalase
LCNSTHVRIGLQSDTLRVQSDTSSPSPGDNESEGSSEALPTARASAGLPLRRDVLKGAAALASGTLAAVRLGSGPAAARPADLVAAAPNVQPLAAAADAPLAQAAPNAPATDETAKLDPYRENSDGQYLTTEQGLRISSTDDSLKAGQRGPTLLEDFHFREKITHFDHERIPERVVHARGAGAHGTFQVYQSMAALTRAAFLQDPSKPTPVFVRFSTVNGFRGSADTARDARGFATKFFTQEGVFDLVGNNIPVFFIQDAIKFPDLVHAFKPEPHNEIPQASTAHDNFWDFASLVPESTHMNLWVLSDRAIPRSFRMMDGFGVNTFRFVNEQGTARFIKFHWKSLQGAHSLVWDEAQKLAGKDPDWLRRDLWDAIDHGNFPEWEFGVQVIEEQDELAFSFDVLDATKIWPEELVPVQRIGKLTLNRNPDNFFAETEQSAFHPGHVVPGIDFSDDPLLQGRLFSYFDTQINRFNSVNFAEVPINRPTAPVHNNQQDGYLRQRIHQGRTNYFPNSLANNSPNVAPPSAGGYVPYAENVQGQKVRSRSDSFKDYFSQATMFWNSLSEPERQHLVQAAHFELGKVETKAIRQRMVDIFENVDHDLAMQVAAGIGIAGPSDGVKAVTRDAIPPPSGRRTVDSSPAVSLENTPKGPLKGRKVAVLVADGVDAAGLQSVKAALEGVGITVEVVAPVLGSVKGAGGEDVPVDRSFITTGSVMYDAVFVPGGKQSVNTLKALGNPLQFVNEAFAHFKPIAALTDGADLLSASDIARVLQLGSTPATQLNALPGVLVSTGVPDAQALAAQLVDAIGQHRFWARGQSGHVPA